MMISSLLLLYLSLPISLLSGLVQGGVVQGNFLSFAERRLNQVRLTMCVSLPGSLAQIGCTKSNELRETGVELGYDKNLPPYMWTNFLAMTVAYAALIETDRLLPALVALQVHRTLGLGNSLRILGYSEDNVNSAYWNYWELIQSQDLGDGTAAGDGLDTYCAYINQEYEQLKTYVRSVYPASDLPTNPEYFVNETMKQSCQSENFSYLIRNDWEHHRREFVYSLMYEDCGGPMALHTVWHWESLFVFQIGQDNMAAYDLLFESFDLLAKANADHGFVCGQQQRS